MMAGQAKLDPREEWGLPAEVWDWTENFARFMGLPLYDAARMVAQAIKPKPLWP